MYIHFFLLHIWKTIEDLWCWWLLNASSSVLWKGSIVNCSLSWCIQNFVLNTLNKKQGFPFVFSRQGWLSDFGCLVVLEKRVVMNGSTKKPLLIRPRGFGLSSDGIEMVPKRPLALALALAQGQQLFLLEVAGLKYQLCYNIEECHSCDALCF